MSTSFQWSNSEGAHYGRLHVKETAQRRGWVIRTSDESQWLQIHLNNRYIKVPEFYKQLHVLIGKHMHK